MKNTICGFSQSVAVKMKKTVTDSKGKEKEIKIDCTDLMILRWFVDFYPKMMKVEIDGAQYAWVKYKSLLEDMPLLDIKKQALADRLKKMCEFGILKRQTIKSDGTFSYFGFGDMYSSLIETPNSQTDRGVYSTTEGVSSQLHRGVYSTTEQINLSTKDLSTKDNNSTKEKKERKTSYDEILSSVEDDSLRELYYEFIKSRKLLKSPMTDRGLSILINKVEKLEPNSIDRQKEMLETAIMNGWKTVYPLKDGVKTNERYKPNDKQDESKSVYNFDKYTL